MATSIGPVAVRERVGSLDVLRGVALCGILLMNIPAMGLLEPFDPPMPATANPDWIAFSIQEVFLTGSMRGLFTLLFGAGVLIMLRRADEPSGGESFEAYFTRCFALMVLGVVNFAVFLWPYEILFNYGVAGLGLVLFRKAKTRVLVTAAIAILAFVQLSYGNLVHTRAENLRNAPAAAAAQAAGKTLTKEQEAALATRTAMNEVKRPSPEALEKERAQRTSYPGVLMWSAKLWMENNLDRLPIAWLGQSFAYMLIGMALFRTGVLSGARSLRFYLGLAVAGYAVGIALRGGVNLAQWTTGFEPNPEQIMWRFWTSEFGRLATTLGLVGLVMVLFKTGALGRLAGGIQAIGRMALTNYVGQSVITSALFYGLGMLDKFGFAQLMGICVVIWIAQGVFSVLWLRRYEMGPLEWGLRQLTYGRRTPLPRVGSASPAPVAVPAE